MGAIGRSALKAYFETGAVPTEAQFIDLMDSIFNLTDDNSTGIPYDSSAELGGNVDADKTNVQTGLKEARDFINTPSSALGTWTPGATTLDKSGSYSSLAISGNVTIAFTGTPKEGIWQKVRTTGWNSTYTLTIPDLSVIMNDSFTDGSAIATGTYDLWFAYVGGEYLINLVSVVVKAVVPPTISTLTIEDASPTDLVIVFNEVVTGTNLGFAINGTTSSVFASISGSGTNTITGVLADAAVFGETITLDYDSGTGDIIDIDSNPLATIAGAAVTNNVAQTYTFVNTHELVTDGTAGQGVTVTDSNLYPSDGAGTDEDVSFEIWVEFPSIGLGKAIFYIRDDNDDSILISFTRTTGDAVNTSFRTDGSNQVVKTSVASQFSAITLHHMVITKTGETYAGIKIYIDGSELTYTTDGSPGTYTGLPALVGNMVLDIGNSIGGSSADAIFQIAREFNAELTSGEVTTLYNSGTPVGLSVGLQAKCVQENLFNNNANADNIGTNGVTQGTATYQTI